MIFPLLTILAIRTSERLVAVDAALAPQIESWRRAHPDQPLRISAGSSGLPREGLDRIAARLGASQGSPRSEESLGLWIDRVGERGSGLYDVLVRVLERKGDGGEGRTLEMRVRVDRGRGTVLSRNDTGVRFTAFWCG